MPGRTLRIPLIVAPILLWLGSVAGFAQTQPADNPAEVYSWRYEEDTVNGQDVVKRVKMTWDEGQTWDKTKMDEIKQQITAGQLPGVPPGSDPNAVATWKLYYDQLKLWQDYLKQNILAEEEFRASVDDITWVYGEGKDQQGGAGSGQTGAEAVVAANQSKSLDDQTGEFFSLGGGPKEGEPPIVTRQHVLEQVLNLYDVLKMQGKEADEKTYKSAQDIVTGLTEREGRRLAYRNWLDDRKDMVMETAGEWGKQQQGQVVVVGGVQYELYSPNQGLPQGAGATNVVRVVTDNLTPYDLLNPDGSQKEPLRR